MAVSTWQWGLGLALVATVASAQEGTAKAERERSPRNVVVMSVPLQGLASQLSLEGERVVGERASLGLGVLASFLDERFRYSNPEQVGGIEGTNQRQVRLGLAPSARFYLTGPAPRGLWVSPRVEVSYGRDSGETLGRDAQGLLGPEPRESWRVGGLAMVGYSVVLESGFTVQGGVGLGAHHDRLTFNTVTLGSDGGSAFGQAHVSQWTLSQRLLLNLGWAF